jgi:predicted RND superfamily exporter protein
MRQRFELALGIERIGLLWLRFPATGVLVISLAAIAAAFGIAQIRIDDSLSQLFRSNTRAFQQYEEVSRQFPSSEFDVLVVVDGRNLLERQSVERLRNLATDLQLVSGTRGAISMFSARQPPEDGQLPAALFPEHLPKRAAYDALIQKVVANEIIRGKLLSLDGQLSLFVVALEPKVAEDSGLSGVVAEIHKTVDEDLSGSGLHAELSGVPVMRLQIRNAVERARLAYNTAGFAAGCLIAFAFFRRLSFMIVAAAPPLTAILFAFGMLGWLDFRLNILLNMMAPLIMVLSFSDSMQLTFAARDRLIAGEPASEAYRGAVLVVGPACVLTHATAALSFVSLLFSSSDLVREFGEVGVLATITALATVLTLLPLLGLFLARKRAISATKLVGTDIGVDALRTFCAGIADRMVSRPGLYSLLSIVLVGVLALLYSQLHPRWNLAEEVPSGAKSVMASHLLDEKLTGANPIDVLIRLPPGQSLYAPGTLATIADVHDILEKQAGVGNVWSLETLRRWLARRAAGSDVGALKGYVNLLPRFLVRRFISAKEDAVLVSGRVPEADAGELLPIVKSLDQGLSAVRVAHPDYQISVTGLSVIAAHNSANMIERLSRGLTIEIVFVAAFIGLAFRSMVVALAVILPGVFPVVLSGDLLWALGDGLQFASVVALTVSFGLSLSATIHFLNRLRLEGRPDEDPAIGVARATVLMGPALILTTVVLACGLVATAFSNLPSLRLFGWLSAFAMVMALIADLFILRPTITMLGRLAHRWRQRLLQSS